MTKFDTFDSVFPRFFTQNSTYDLNGIFLCLTRIATDDASVETVVLRSNFSMLQHNMFEAARFFYGHPLRTAAGENCYMRATSYIQNGQFSGRLFDKMVSGEIREISVITIKKDSCFRNGVWVLIRFICPTTINDDVNSPFALSIVPLGFVDRHRKKPNKKVVSVRGIPLLFLGSMGVYRNNNSQVIESCPSFSLFDLKEWAAGVQNPSKYPNQSVCMVESVSIHSYEFEYCKLMSKLDAHFERLQYHPSADYDQTNGHDVTKISNVFGDCSSVGFLLDLLCTGAVDAVSLPFFTDPCGFPLYISICVILAATPFLLNRNSEMNGNGNVATAKVFASYRSLTNSNTTVLEVLVQLAFDQLRVDKTSTPVCADHLMRQGLTLCNELCNISDYDSTESEFCGKESFNDAFDVINPVGAPVKNGFPSNGIRCATRCARLGKLLQIMVDVNEMLESGIWKLSRLYRENTGEAAVRHSNPKNVMLNVEAWDSASTSCRAYIVQGPLVLLRGTGLTVFPIRRLTRATCGECNERFDFLTMTTKNQAVQCSHCHAFYCDRCYKLKVNNSIFLCTSCTK